MEDVKYRIYLEEIAALFAQGLSPEHVAIKYNVDISFVEKVLADPKFEEILREIDPAAHETWKSAQSQDISRKRLKAQINEDAPEFYKIVADLVRNESSSLTDRERCDYALRLAQMSDAARKDIEVAEVILNEHQLHIISEALKETSV